VAIDRISKYVHYKLYNEQTKKTAIDFLNEVYNIFPFKIHTILTDNGIQFSNTSLKGLNNVKNTEQPTSKSSFTKECESLNIRHKTTQVKHPWTNGQVEVFNRFIKDNTIRKYKYISKEQLLNHLDNTIQKFNETYNKNENKGM
jgi:transposase InsO family protein